MQNVLRCDGRKEKEKGREGGGYCGCVFIILVRYVLFSKHVRSNVYIRYIYVVLTFNSTACRLIVCVRLYGMFPRLKKYVLLYNPKCFGGFISGRVVEYLGYIPYFSFQPCCHAILGDLLWLRQSFYNDYQIKSPRHHGSKCGPYRVQS